MVAVPFRDVLFSHSSHGRSIFTILGKLAHVLCHSLPIMFFNEKPGFTVNNLLRYAGMPSTNDRQATSRCFSDGNRPAFSITGERGDGVLYKNRRSLTHVELYDWVGRQENQPPMRG